MKLLRAPRGTGPRHSDKNCHVATIHLPIFGSTRNHDNTGFHSQSRPVTSRERLAPGVSNTTSPLSPRLLNPHACTRPPFPRRRLSSPRARHLLSVLPSNLFVFAGTPPWMPPAVEVLLPASLSPSSTAPSRPAPPFRRRPPSGRYHPPLQSLPPHLVVWYPRSTSPAARRRRLRRRAGYPCAQAR